jgi:hypothetical protein
LSGGQLVQGNGFFNHEIQCACKCRGGILNDRNLIS